MKLKISLRILKSMIMSLVSVGKRLGGLGLLGVSITRSIVEKEWRVVPFPVSYLRL
jgi:hypothetical protein